MKKISEPIIFFGSGPVAAASLELLNKNFSIEAVITKPKPAHHKGSFPVIDVSDALALPIHTVRNKAELSSLMSTATFTSRLGILIDFGIIIGQDVIDYFPLGIINSHFSILPEWRGADPISFAILSGQKTTGVSLMLLVAAMDEGPLLGYGEQPLSGHETTPELTNQLILLSDALLTHDIPRFIQAETKGAPQSITGRSISYSRKLTKQDGIIDWHKPAKEIEREIRAFIEWPKSRTVLAGKEIIITKAHIVDRQGKPGNISIENKELFVCCGEDCLSLETLKPAGKNEMSASAFLAGYHQLFDRYRS